MGERAVTPWERERKYQARLAEAYDARRVVVPEFTLAQAKAALAYLDAKYETEPQGTTLRYFRHQLADAIEAVSRGR